MPTPHALASPSHPLGAPLTSPLWPQAMLHHLASPVLACNRSGALLYANRAAWRELACAQLVNHLDGKVGCPQVLDQALLRSAIFQAVEARRTRMLPLGPLHQRVQVAVMPIACPLSGAPAAMLMLGQREPSSALSLELLAAQHRLTLTETKVLAALLARQQPGEIAVTHRVRLSTVRTQIQAIRAKFGARSIDELLLQASVLPPVCAGH